MDRAQLDEYLTRIGLAGARERPGLGDVCAAHAASIVFENCDIQLGRRISLAPADVFAKLVRARRGGYCFEQNSLLAAALAALGFAPRPLAARVVIGRPAGAPASPRTHMLLEVPDGGERWLCDAGFGAEGLYRPLRLVAGEQECLDERYRLTEQAGWWTLAVSRPAGWLDLYSFTREPMEPIDFELANWFTSTHPESRFVRTLTAQRLSPGGLRTTLRGRAFSVERAGEPVEARTIAGHDELLAVLSARFGLDFPPGTRFRAWEEEAA